MQDEFKEQRDLGLIVWSARPVSRIAETPISEVWRVSIMTGPAVVKIWRKGPGNELAGVSLMHAWRDSAAVPWVRPISATNTSMLMEYLEGDSLGDLARRGGLERADALLAQVAHRLHATPPRAPVDLPMLHDLFAPLFALTYAPECPRTLHGNMARATELAAALLATQPRYVPLHGDLHHDNVILTPRGPVAFDAKGVLGDPAYELANAFRHPRGINAAVRAPDRITARQALFARALNVDPRRLARWAVAKCALSIAWRAKGRLSDDTEAALLGDLLMSADPDA